MKNIISHRIFGLDIFRSLAIILVMIEHGKVFFNFNVSLPDGVDLFFVLSGYLIGNIIIKSVTNNKFNFINLRLFVIRRWFRTLPNYFLFLLINILFIHFDLIKGIINKYIVTYFVFFQNFHKPYDFLFWESWSLSVEEWFYLFFPFLIFIFFKLNLYISLKRKFLIVTLMFIVLPLIYRICFYQENLDFDLYYRKLVLTRLDTIGFGILGAYLYNFHNHNWLKNKNTFFVIGAFFLIFMSNIAYVNDFFHKTFCFTLTGLSILFLIPKFSSFKDEKIRFKPFRFISKISYSMYLSHLIILQLISNLFSPSVYHEKILAYLFFWIITILISYFIYNYYEKPLTNLRDKFTH